MFNLVVLASSPAIMRFLRLWGWGTERIHYFTIMASLIAIVITTRVFAFCAIWQHFTLVNRIALGEEQLVKNAGFVLSGKEKACLDD